MCQIFQVHHSSFYRWQKRLAASRTTRKAFITSEIMRIYQWSQCRYGSPRIAKELAMLGIQASRGFVGKIMKQQNIRSITKLKFKKTTNSSHTCLIAENRLNQDFKVNDRNEVWVSDITYIKTREGWIYLTVVIDLFDRKVIGWSVSDTLKATDTSITSFKKAILNRSLDHTTELIFHSDKGKQYACRKFISLLENIPQISRSMSGKGNCYDNAVAESFFKTLKVELVYQNKYETKEQAKASVIDFIENFYNSCRRHSALENLTIEEFQNLYPFHK